jgi:NitT/TauT family transport system permease protein
MSVALPTSTSADQSGATGSPAWRALTSRTGARLTSYVAFVLSWQLLSWYRDRVPAPWETLDFVWTELTGGSHGGRLKGEFWKHFSATVVRFTIGLTFGFIAGALVGIAIGLSSFFRSMVNDVMLVFLALPAVIWAFLTTMWFGLGWEAPVYTVVLSSAPFVAVNVAQGVRAVSPELHRMSDAFGVPRHRRLRSLLLPAITGYLFTGLRFAFIIGWNGVLLAEWFGSSEGVGWRARFWYDAARYRGFVGWVLIFVTFIFLVDGLVLTPLQRRAFRWRMRGDGNASNRPG